MEVRVRRAGPSDQDAISSVAMAAFGGAEGPEIVQIVADLAVDESARPLLSLVATSGESVVAHVMFSKARVDPSSVAVSAALLAPLAVQPDCQARGIGSLLVTEGFEQLTETGVELVFVLGHPGYYPRFGFVEAGIRGFEAPYPIAQKNAPAWMVHELRPGAIGRSSGRVACAAALDDPRYWHE